MTRGTIRKETLPNGITLLTEHMPHVRSVTLGIWLKRGSRHEPGRLNGASHFIEHLVFKGTESRTARDIALAVDSIAGRWMPSPRRSTPALRWCWTRMSRTRWICSPTSCSGRCSTKELERERR